jgi:glutathione-regulated potassium-efflux system ancillary protein KefF
MRAGRRAGWCPHNAPVILILHAHPHPQRSIAGKALLDAVSDLAMVKVRALYDLYPDFAIDAAAEQSHLAAARLVVWQHPFYWYGVPALLKLWWEEVLVRGWAYGEGGTALQGKDCLWVTTTGALPEAYAEGGAHGHPVDAFVPAIRQTARFCGMNWLDPIVVHGAHRVSTEALRAQAARYRERLETYARNHG